MAKELLVKNGLARVQWATLTIPRTDEWGEGGKGHLQLPHTLTWMPLKTPWVCILYWAPQRMGVVWLSLSYPVPWLQTQRGDTKAQGLCGCSLEMLFYGEERRIFFKAHSVEVVGLFLPLQGAGF